MGYTGREWENGEYENSDRNRNFGTQPFKINVMRGICYI